MFSLDGVFPSHGFIIFIKLQYRKMKFYQGKAQVCAGVQLSCPFPRGEFLEEAFRQLNSNQGMWTWAHFWYSSDISFKEDLSCLIDMKKVRVAAQYPPCLL